MSDYQSFLQSKIITRPDSGFIIDPSEINPMLSGPKFGWQGDIVRWALRLGRAALFEDCGLGKTGQQLEFGYQVCRHTNGDFLIFAPLSVTWQTAREAEKFGRKVTVCETQADVRPGINITNYEKREHFNPEKFAGVCIDESSILKSFMGKTKRELCEMFAKTPFRMACTATPSPNDVLELGNHAAFLGVMDSDEMISRWFANDTMAAGSYSLKPHGAKDFWRWVSSWAVSLEKPSDLGYSDEGFVLPPLNTIVHCVKAGTLEPAGGKLFVSDSLSATNMHNVLRQTTPMRAAEAAKIIATLGDKQCVVWCNTDYEADALAAVIPNAVEVRGSMPHKLKASRLEAFAKGEIQILVTKASIAGYGMNWQHMHENIVVGLSYSFEDFYQLIRRSWRFGQTMPVNAHVITSDAEGEIVNTVKRKQEAYTTMKKEMQEALKESQLESVYGNRKLSTPPPITHKEGDNWKLYHGDCVEAIKHVADASVGLSVYSPPFSSLYIYSDSEADMGNSASDEEFFKHYGYLVPEILRATIPGRLTVVHCKDLPLYKGRDGAAGLRDFPGEIIRLYEKHGWVFHSRCTIWKDPVIEMQRTKNHGLLYKQLCKDSAASRQGMADYILAFRKWDGMDGEGVQPVTTGGERFDHYAGLEPPDPNPIAAEHGLNQIRMTENGRWPHKNPFKPGTQAYREWSIMVWQKYASPVWFDINQTNVLNYRKGRDEGDEKHICPLQKDVVERAIHLWSNPGDLVLSPFTGIGTEGVVSLQCGRKFVGMELKDSYHRTACGFLAETEEAMKAEQFSLFTGAAA